LDFVLVVLGVLVEGWAIGGFGVLRFHGLVCYSAVEMRSEIVIVALFFLVLFLLLRGVEMWITPDADFLIFSVARRCGRIEQGAEAIHGRGDVEARKGDAPCLLFAWFTVKTGHYPGHYSESCKKGRVTTKLYEEMVA
jgi:hypothetical protein